MSFQLKIDLRKAILVIILLFALGLRLFYFVGININDDTEYADAAFRIATGKGMDSYAFGSIDSIRFLMVLPVALFYWFFGVSDFTSSLYPLCSSILTILLAYFLAKRLFSWEVGIATALMLALFPLDLVYCTQLVPTVPLACVLTGSLLSFIKGDMLIDEGGKHSSLKKANILILFSGILVGIGWMINEPAPLFGLVIFLYPLLKGKFRPNHLLFLVGILGVFLAESILFKIITGDFFWRFKVIHEEEKTVLTNTAMDYYPITFFKLWNINFCAAQGHFGFFWYLFVGSFVYLLVRRKKQIFFLVFGMWLILLYFQFGFMTLGGRPIAKWIRYMEMILPFVTMIVSFSLITLGEIGIGKWKGWILLFLFLLTNLWFIPNAVEANRSHTRPMKLVAKFLDQQSTKTPVYIDAGAMGFIDVYLGKNHDLRHLEGSHLNSIQDAYVVINGSRGVIENRDMRALLPSHGKNAPSSWKLLKRIDSSSKRLCSIFSPLIYYAPAGAAPHLASIVEEEQKFTKIDKGAVLMDSKEDVVCYSQKVHFPISFIDILNASIYSPDSEVLTLEIKLAKDPNDMNMEDIYLMYLWYLDMDQDPNTGQRHGGVGSEFNIRLSKGADDWGLYVDDNNPRDPYEFWTAPTGFVLKDSVIQVRLPRKAFSRIESFNWEVEASATNIMGPRLIDCHDYSAHSLTYSY